MSQKYACRRCGRLYSFEEYEQSLFCRECETYLMPKSKVAKIWKHAHRPLRATTAKELLPKSYEMRNGQMEFVIKAASAIKKEKIFLGSAPCGIGKSLASLLAMLPHLEDNKLMICFRTRSQLHIYLKELRALSQRLTAVSFFSKQDMCPLRLRGDLSYFDFFEECKNLKDNCETATKPYCRFYWKNIRHPKQARDLALDCALQVLSPREAVRAMSKHGFCAYEALKRTLSSVKVFLGTYHYVFDSKIRQAILKSFQPDLKSIYLIVDEAHNLPIFSRELLSDRLPRNTVERALTEIERFDHRKAPFAREYLNLLEGEIFQRGQQILRKAELRRLSSQKVEQLILNRAAVSGAEAAEVLLEYGEYIKERRQELGHQKILSYNHRVGEFLENFLTKKGAQYIHLIEKDHRNRVILRIDSFDGRELTDPVLRQVKGSILMSGFLSPLKVYRDLTLHGQEGVCLEEFGSPFPSENRLILVAQGVSSLYKKRTKKMLDKWRAYIETISQANRGNIAVFFTSYGLMHKVLPLLTTPRNMIVETRKTKRNAVIKQLARSSNNMLVGVMGGKLSEGLDYPNNSLTCVVATGLPYAKWNIYHERLIDYFEHQFPNDGRAYAYLAPAMLRLIQTCGRVHRSAHDKGCIVILDERVMQPEIRNQLPAYYQDEIKIVRSPDRCMKEIEEFWHTHHKDNKK